jgi:Rv2525c-like, glycoside hydrolase-like domain
MLAVLQYLNERINRVKLNMMQKMLSALAVLLLLGAAATGEAQHASQHSYPGFDRNDYPGDASLKALRQTFHYTGYWLNNPPGEQHNTWAGKRRLLKRYGFGFLVLFNGRTYAELKNAESRGTPPAALGASDGKAALAAAAREGFPPAVLIFLDQEEGGRLLPEQAAYLFAWADAVRDGGARAGVYCSGIDVPDGSGAISTARDIVEREKEHARSQSKGKSAERLRLWIANDQCPPSPGCTMRNPPLSAVIPPALSGSIFAWQYALSPRRAQFSTGCPANQAPDGNCYAPGLAHGANTFVDLNTADSPDPSETP